jgi:uncharacterized membrane protein YhaH (DUF805 family)
MSFNESVKTCFSKYVTFSGRASRSEYWWFALFIIISSAVLGLIDGAIFGSDPVTQQPNGLLRPLFTLAILLPVLAAGWRRMHDSGRPGWLLLLPMLVSFATAFFLMMGVVTFSGLQNAGANPEALLGPAAFLGLTGMFTAMVVQLVLAIMLLWWLTRPSQEGSNEYGPPPAT